MRWNQVLKCPEVFSSAWGLWDHFYTFGILAKPPGAGCCDWLAGVTHSPSLWEALLHSTFLSKLSAIYSLASLVFNFSAFLVWSWQWSQSQADILSWCPWGVPVFISGKKFMSILVEDRLHQQHSNYSLTFTSSSLPPLFFPSFLLPFFPSLYYSLIF